jgi:hypothetical protein
MLRRILQVTAVITTVAGLGVVGAGCLDRPITSNNPTTKTNFTTAQQASTIDKVDLLFDIDNSASMGDKQYYLEQAVPDLINRLVNPNCNNNTTQASAGPSNFGDCSAYTNTTVEFPPVHNMHIGIISSSLGTRGVPSNNGAVCDPTNANDANTGMFLDGTMGLNTHVDDQGELLNRTAPVSLTDPQMTAENEGTSTDTGGQNFLDWFPTMENGMVVAGNVGVMAAPGAVLAPATQLSVVGTLTMTPGTLEGDFAALVAGVHTYGCGIESQLETWYRFLIQPDPYASIDTSSGAAQWVGVDKTIIQQRHDFLRPDSLVAIIVLTDENDSEIDVRSFGGQGWSFMDEGPPAGSFTPPRGTAICETDPGNTMGSPPCTSCAYCTKGSPADICNDPNCKLGPYTAENDWGFYINVRHVHMQQKYGIIPQFPLQRYVLGLTSPKVPDRTTEYPTGASSYQGGTNQDPQDLNCTNPLFAATLPGAAGDNLDDPTVLCNANAMAGPRTTNLIFYAHIGGVPHQLLQTTPGEKDSMGNVLCPMGTAAADCPQKNTLAVADWTKILGQGPATGGSQWDYTGIDPHMIENYDPPRTGTAYDTGASETVVTGGPSASGGGPDPINGRDWTTDSTNPSHVLPVDREYACTFPLYLADGTPNPRDCSKGDSDPVNSFACDCEPPTTGGNWYTAPNDVPSVCGLPQPAEAPSATNDYTTQYYAKTYPTIRELTLAQMMGPQGIISSLCPIHVIDMEGGNDPLYGYRPAITAIVDRLKNALASQCLPQPLNVEKNEAGASVVPCLVLATIPGTVGKSESAVCNPTNYPSLSVPNAQILQTFNQNQHALWMSDMVGTDPSTLVTCEVQQISVAAMPAGGTTSGTCVGMGATNEQGWCYVTGTASGACDTQAVLFTSNALPNGATVNLQCILENQGTGGGSGDGG